MAQIDPTILHIDMDAFYASVEERERPELRGLPVVVGGTPQGRGVVAAANYEARRYGIHSAMPAATARRLCPDLIMLPGRMDHYAAVSAQIHGILERYTPLIEPLSLDEAFLDVAASRRLFGPAARIGRRLKHEIYDELGLVASVGVAPNKFLAKIASDLDKPDGFVVVEPHGIQAFLDPLPVSRLWGVGPVAQRSLHGCGIHTVGDLRQWGRSELVTRFGQSGEHLWALAHGVDERPVVPDHEAKSISHETTFAEDIHDPAVMRGWLMELTEQVAYRLRTQGLKGRTVQLKVRFNDFQTLIRAETQSEPTDSTGQLWQVAARLLEQRLPKDHPPVRLLGVGVSGFGEPPRQGRLFDDTDERTQVDSVTDALQERFGPGAVRRARGLRRGK